MHYIKVELSLYRMSHKIWFPISRGPLWTVPFLCTRVDGIPIIPNHKGLVIYLIEVTPYLFNLAQHVSCIGGAFPGRISTECFYENQASLPVIYLYCKNLLKVNPYVASYRETSYIHKLYSYACRYATTHRT